MRIRQSVTFESLQRDRERRAKARSNLAREYEQAADYLEGMGDFRSAVAFLRYEAKKWRRDATS